MAKKEVKELNEPIIPTEPTESEKVNEPKPTPKKQVQKKFSKFNKKEKWLPMQEQGFLKKKNI